MPRSTPPHSSSTTPRSRSLPLPLRAPALPPAAPVPGAAPASSSPAHAFHRFSTWNRRSRSEMYPRASEMMQVIELARGEDGEGAIRM